MDHLTYCRNSHFESGWKQLWFQKIFLTKLTTGTDTQLEPLSLRIYHNDSIFEPSAVFECAGLLPHISMSGDFSAAFIIFVWSFNVRTVVSKYNNLG